MISLVNVLLTSAIPTFKMGSFYICPTPIGNLNDISTRLNQVLSDVDIIYAEDTRVAKKLLSTIRYKKECQKVYK